MYGNQLQVSKELTVELFNMDKNAIWWWVSIALILQTAHWRFYEFDINAKI